MKNVLITLAVVAVVGLGVWAFYFSDGSVSPFAKKMDKTENAVALVNGEQIARADFETLQAQIISNQKISTTTLSDEEKKQLQTEVLNFAVSQTLLRQAALKSGIVVSDAEIADQIKNIKGQFETETLYTEALAAQSMTEADLGIQIKADLLMQSYLEKELRLSEVKATDAEIATVYEQAAATDKTLPPLKDVRDQVEGAVIQQKKQGLINAFAETLRKGADIQILL